MMEEQEFDVVLDALYQRKDSLLKMVHANMDIGMFNIMDQIRLEQISQLEEAIKLWQKNTNV